MNLLAKQFFLDALEAMNPSYLVSKAVARQRNRITVNGKELQSESQPIYCIAAGKASRPMALALKEKLDIPSSKILCITPDKEDLESYCLSSSHPIPDTSSIEAADKLIQFIEKIPLQAIVFFLLSGGTSALVCQPANGLNLEDISAANTLLLHSGAAIHEINSIRKHLSSIKGGQLLPHFPSDCTLVDLAISDVPTDALEHIGSGLTIPDSSTFKGAYNALKKHKLWGKMPENIQNHIEKGLTSKTPETIKPGEDPLENHHSFIIGSAKLFAEKMANLAKEKGFDTWMAKKAFDNNVKDVAKYITTNIKQAQENTKDHCALLFYGESTVKVTGNGKGGRNQELALQGALEIAGMDDGVTWLSAGTDGIDGPTDAAGAIVDNSTISKAKEKGIEPKQFIRDNDSYYFHEKMGTLLKTGATGNNVMDIVIILVEK